MDGCTRRWVKCAHIVDIWPRKRVTTSLFCGEGGLVAHAKTLAAQRIRVNTVAPGSIEFPGGFWDTIKQQNRAMYDAALANCPVGRMGTAEEVAAAVVVMASPKAEWVSGAMLTVDGVQHKGIF